MICVIVWNQPEHMFVVTIQPSIKRFVPYELYVPRECWRKRNFALGDITFAVLAETMWHTGKNADQKKTLQNKIIFIIFWDFLCWNAAKHNAKERHKIRFAYKVLWEWSRISWLRHGCINNFGNRAYQKTWPPLHTIRVLLCPITAANVKMKELVEWPGKEDS